MKRIVLLTVLLLIVVSAGASAEPITGKVLFRGSGAPVPRALVEISAGAAQGRAVTLDDGSFYIQDLAGNSFHVTITYKGVKSELNQVARQKSMTLSIAP